jgi:hypothetical protein
VEAQHRATGDAGPITPPRPGGGVIYFLVLHSEAGCQMLSVERAFNLQAGILEHI